MSDHPLCEVDGCGDPSVDVHHLDEAGPAGDNSDENLQALCHSHHSLMTDQSRPRWR